MFAAPFSIPSSRPSRSFPPRNDSLIYPISVSLVKKQIPEVRVVIPNGCEGSKKDLSLRFETRISPGVYPELCRRGRNDREARSSWLKSVSSNPASYQPLAENFAPAAKTFTDSKQNVENYPPSSFQSNGAKGRLDSRVEVSTLAERRIEAPTVSSAVAIPAM